jgi:hypothetical protein
MNCLYLFLANAPIDKKSFEGGLEGLPYPFEVTYKDEKSGTIVSDTKSYAYLDGLLMPLHDDLGVSIAVLCVHRDGELEEKCLKESLGYFPNAARFLSDIIMKELSFGNYSSLPLLSNEFKGVKHEVLLTAGTYLRCGLDASLAASQLFIHRNTFNYRLNQFIDETGLDIRDYHNALLLEIFFQLGSLS